MRAELILNLRASNITAINQLVNFAEIFDILIWIIANVRKHLIIKHFLGLVKRPLLAINLHIAE